MQKCETKALVQGNGELRINRYFLIHSHEVKDDSDSGIFFLS